MGKQELQRLINLKTKQEIAELSGREKNEKRDLETQYPQFKNTSIKQMEEELHNQEQNQNIGMRR